MRLAWFLMLLVGCASASPVGKIRFSNDEPVWRVDDARKLPKEPKEREYNRTLYHVDGYFVRRAARWMEMNPDVRAQDVNSLDEVPDSTWFTNRIGIREVTNEELVRGPNLEDSPFDHLPWTITGAKVGGMSVGFTFEDALERKFLLKFDGVNVPELETGAHAIVHRILWAIGYNVPQDFVGFVDRKDLVVGAKAKKKDFSEDKLDAALKLVYWQGGKIRVLASRFVEGKPIGPYAREGVRKDDPNDVIPHEQRRSLRGQYPIFGWLAHTDLQEDNTIDSFANGHVVHYLIDFGKALGVMAVTNKNATVGHQFYFDIGDAMHNLFTFGIEKHAWDEQREVGLRGIGLYNLEHYVPGAWRPQSIYFPLLDHDRFDGFWGAKLAMRFRRDQIATIVDQAQYSDPKSREYMIETLIARQRATGRYWFTQVAPLDDIALEGDQLCFTDLMRSYQLSVTPTTYAVDTYDRDGAATGFKKALESTPTGRVCTAVPLVASNAGYTIVRLRVFREKFELPAVVVHVARDAAGKARVIGLRRR